jgi:hypothetical protein
MPIQARQLDQALLQIRRKTFGYKTLLKAASSYHPYEAG